MKKSLHLITAFCFAILINCCSFNVARAQYVTIPDSVFAKWLNTHGFSKCMIGNQLDTTCKQVLKRKKIDCTNNKINSIEGIQYFDSLTELTCPKNHIDSISQLPPLIQIFNVNSNQLHNLPALPASLQYLSCKANQIDSLPYLPFGLIAIECSLNPINKLPALPSSLLHLSCTSNQLTYLPVLPQTLISLWCGDNDLDSLPVLPPQLQTIICNNDHLNHLPALPLSLTKLVCSNNQMGNLPTLPPSLTDLDCSFDSLGSLPLLPDSLKYLTCNNNNLSNFPPLPSVLSNLHMAFNPYLTCFPLFDNSLYELDWNNCPGILCNPNNRLITFCNPALNTIPVCDMYNINGCAASWSISGKTFYDSNSNCSIDSSDLMLTNLKLKLYNVAGNLVQQTFSNDEGFYGFLLPKGTYNYKIDTTNLPFIVSCPSLGYYHSLLGLNDSIDYDKNFGLQCKPGFDVSVNSVARTEGEFTPGFNATVNIKAGDMSNRYGLHCASGVSGDVRIVINGDATFISAIPGSLIPVVNGDTLIYSIADFGTVNFNSDFKISVHTDSIAPIGSQICFDVNVTPTSGDINPANNSLLNCFTVYSGSNPNNKSVYPTNRFIIPDNDNLTYTINFQNTGTASAQHIYILDTLDAAIDESSFELLAYSHQPQVQIIGKVVRFNFPNINLPDSNSNEPASHGYVQYRVKLKNNLPQGTLIQNTSYIYFDFNTPVQTNTVVDTLIDCNSFASFQLTNPNFCNGDTVFANAVLAYNSNTDWFVDSVFISNNQNISIPNLSVGEHEIKLNASNAYCNVDVVSTILVNTLPIVTLNAFPNADTLCINYGVQTISNGNPPGGTLSGVGVSGTDFNPAQAALGWNVITYSYTDLNGCSNTATDSVYVDVCLGVNSILGNETISIYPNPATDAITISYNFKNASTIKIELYNSIGEKIKVLNFGKTLVGFQTLRGLSKGIYFVKVMVDEKVLVKKLMVE